MKAVLGAVAHFYDCPGGFFGHGFGIASADIYEIKNSVY